MRCLPVPPVLDPMSDMPGAAVTAVVGAQMDRTRPSRHEVAQVCSGVTLPLVCPLASTCSHLGALRGHSVPLDLGSVRQIPADHPAVSKLLLICKTEYTEIAEISSITESPERSILTRVPR
jgi:hypothetical protein